MNKLLRTAVYGFAVGDALGVPYEFKERDTFSCEGMISGGTWGQLAGTWSDDTSLVLATCDSIRECNGINLEDMMHRFKRWFYDFEYTARDDVFDCGGTTYRAIRRYKNGAPLFICGEKSNLSNGNGSLMRILPLAFTDADSATIAYVSSLTHANQTSINCCFKYVMSIHHVVRFKNLSAPDKGVLNRTRDEVKSTGYVVDSYEAAKWCAGTSHGYSEAVLKAVNLGGDTDTIAALTGALAALQWGYDSIPKEWIDKLANKELIERCLF